MRIVYQTVKRITNEILGVKGLRDRSVVIRVEGGGEGAVDFLLRQRSFYVIPP